MCENKYLEEVLLTGDDIIKMAQKATPHHRNPDSTFVFPHVLLHHKSFGPVFVSMVGNGKDKDAVMTAGDQRWFRSDEFEPLKN